MTEKKKIKTTRQGAEETIKALQEIWTKSIEDMKKAGFTLEAGVGELTQEDVDALYRTIEENPRKIIREYYEIIDDPSVEEFTERVVETIMKAAETRKASFEDKTMKDCFKQDLREAILENLEILERGKDLVE